MTIDASLVPAVESDSPANQTTIDAAKETFQWTQQWYPVAVVETLDPSRPHALQVLGKALVIWQDAQQQWNCFEDACPHRLAPLSEGRVEADGTLLCAYHAWQFDSNGKCLGIPQSKDKTTEETHCNRPQACAIAYPTQERQGLLWVWPEAGESGFNHSQERSPRLITELETSSNQVIKLFWNQRDLPYGWDYFMENVADPAHVPVSHHGIMGSRYTDATYYDMPRLREVSTQEGFAFGVTNSSPAITDATHDFQPPCLMKISTTFTDGGQLILVLYATPTRPGWCRHIGCQILVKNEAGNTPPGLGFFALPMPQWLGHVLASLFLHQDLVFLHYQERTLGQRGRNRWLDEVYTPNPQDKMIITFRQWLEYRAGGGVAWDKSCDPSLPPPEYNKDKLFDVWSTHTKDCRYCQTALKRIDQLTTIAIITTVGLLIAGVMVDARTMAAHMVLAPTTESGWATPPLAFWGLLSGAGIMAIFAGLLRKFRQLFYVYRFEHADND